MRLFAFFLAATAPWAPPAGAAMEGDAAEPSALYRDPAANPAARAADLVARMTLAEKASQVQHDAPAIPRLDVPAYDWWNEGLHGVARAGEATVFPQAIGLAATWDPLLLQNVADAIATEHRGIYTASRDGAGGTTRYRGLTVWSPNVNIFRDPRWGRGQETYGEDPYLTSRMGVAFIRGLQGDDPLRPKTVAAVKHFAVHSGPEASRHSDNIHPSARDLTETYLPAFHAAVTEAKAQSLMCAYNALDGVPACGSKPYLQTILRDEWKFKGWVVSDCAAVADFYLPTSHAYVKTGEEAVARAFEAGTDLICDFGANTTSDPATTVNAVRQGLLDEKLLDASLLKLFETRYRLGTMDRVQTGPYSAISKTDVDTPAHRALALDAARKSMVLLKNDGLLPLKTAPRHIAVIGPNADSVDALVGNYNGTPSRPQTLLSGLRARFPGARIDYVEGTGWVAPPLEDIPDAAFCLDAACSRRGLIQEEFAAPDFQGHASTKEVLNAVFSWGRPTRQPRDGTVRWSGWLNPAESGRYRFRYTGHSGYRIFIDDRLVADVWDIAWPTSDNEVELVAGKPVKIRVEAAQKGSRGTEQLRWSPPGSAEDKAIAAARDADLIVFAGGLTARLEGEEMQVSAPGFAGGDRTSLDLPAPQQSLLEALHATGRPVVLVLMNGSAMSVNWADQNLPAIVEAWYPGGEGGQAIAELIAGDFSPAGRLPITFPKSADQLPPFRDYSMKGRTYRYSAAEPLYPFGYGLSYTQFSYSAVALDKTRVTAGDQAQMTVEVRNSGSRAGDEVVQLYASRALPDAPRRTLVGFQRITLQPGEAQTLAFSVNAKAMSVVDANGNRVVEPGVVDLWVGGGQPGARGAVGQAAKIVVTGRREIGKF